MAQLWNIRGVSEEHRRIAKSAAAGCGLSIGRWLERVIEMAGAIGASNFKMVPVEATEEEILIPPGPDIEPRKKPEPVRECPHGNTEGHYCTKCGKVV